MATYHVTHVHSFENCFSGNSESTDLWKQIPSLAKENNVSISFFKVNPTEHTFFLLMEAEDYSQIENTIGQCKKLGDFNITPVIEQTFYS
tara:strand:+ start:58 stop:327 length:270 start_codon:yes stop_codon:yes gene_type:complete